MPHEEVEAGKITRLAFSHAYQGDWGYIRSVRFPLSRWEIRSEASDIVQTAWLRCWQSRSRLKDERCLGSYASTIIRHLVANVARRAKPLSQLTPDHDPAGPDKISVNTILVRQVLGSLPPQQKRLLELVYCEGFTCDEVPRSLWREPAKPSRPAALEFHNRRPRFGDVVRIDQADGHEPRVN
jgi:RNA polymerase sigma factor (sigma-70 family)